MASVVPRLIKIGKTESANFESRMYSLGHDGYRNVTYLKRAFAIEVEDYDDKEKMLHITALQNKLVNDKKLLKGAKTSDYKIFAESVFPKAFQAAAMSSYSESRDTYKTLFENKAKYDAIMSVLADMLFDEAARANI